MYEIELSKKEMEEKNIKTGNAFQTVMHERARGDLEHCSFRQDALDTHEAIRRVMEEELSSDCRHFSRFLITTDTPSQLHLDSIRGGGDRKIELGGRDPLSWHLADVYYRLLHGPYGEGNGKPNNLAKYMLPKISLEYHSQATRKWQVRDLRDIHNNKQSQFMRQQVGNIFRCEVAFTPPPADSETPAGVLCVARVEAVYYRKKWDGETHPYLVEEARLKEKRVDEKEEEAKNDRRRAAASRVGAPQPVPPQPQEQLSADDDKDSRVLEELRKLKSTYSACSQFWNGRLIPTPEDKLLWFMEVSQGKDKADFKDALTRIHYSVFFAYPALTDRVKLAFNRNLIEVMNQPSDPAHGHSRDEYIVDGKGQSKKCLRTQNLKEHFRLHLRKWMELDENYKFDRPDFIEQVSLDEDYPHFTRVRLSDELWVKQGDVQLIRLKASKEPLFIRVLCIRQQNIKTEEYLERHESDVRVGSHGSVIGYVEPREKEESAPAASTSFKFTKQLSLQSLLRAEAIKHRPAIDLKLAPYRLRSFPLRLVDKQISPDDFNKAYQLAVKKAAETFPTRLAVYALPWHEVRSEKEMQKRVKDCFPGCSVVALTANLDDEQLPVPVANEKVRQCTYLVKDQRSRPRVVKEESEAKDNRRAAGARTSNPRAGQLASRRRIPRVGQREEKEEQEEEMKQIEPEVRYSNSGRLIRPPRDLMTDGLQHSERSSKRRTDDTGGGQRKRKKGEDGRRDRGSDVEGDEEMVVEDDIVELQPPHLSRTLVEGGEYETEVLSIQHATALLRNSLNRADRSVNGFQEKRFHAVGLHQVEFTLLKKTVDGDRDHVQPITINVRVFPGIPHSIRPATPQALSLRLGQRSNEGVRLFIEDELHNQITPSVMRGWKGAELCSLRMWCEELPQLRVSADSDKLLPYEPKDQYQIVGLKIEPSEDQEADELVLDSERLITCCIEFTIPAVVEGEENGTLVVKQQVRLLPGEPQHLQEDFPDSVTLTNDDLFPDFSLQYYDAFGKPATLTDDADVPLVSVWCDDERVEEWAADKIAAQRMQTNGLFESTALQLPPFFVQPRALANIMTTNRERELQRGVPADQLMPGEHTFAVHLKVEVGGEVKIHKECHVLLQARALPSFLMVAQSKDDELNIDTVLEVQAKPFADITLLLHGIDDGGFSLPLDSAPNEPMTGWRSDLPPALRKAIRVTVHGLVDLIEHPYECGLNELDELGFLPAVKTPRRIENRRLECEVSVEFDEARLVDGVVEGLSDEQKSAFEDDLSYLRTRLPLTTKLIVNMQPSRPFQWSASVPSSVRCNMQWQHAVQLFAVDRFGNRVSIPKSIAQPRIRVMAIVPHNNESRVDDREQKGAADVTDSAMETDSVQSHHSSGRGSEAAGAESANDTAYQPVELYNADAVGVSVGPDDDDDVEVFEWSHFVCERAYLLMKAGPASLTVYDDNNELHQSCSVEFTVEPGAPKLARVYMKDPTTGKLRRLVSAEVELEGSGDSSSSNSNGGTIRAEQKVDEPDPIHVLPVRTKFEQLVVKLLDRAKNEIRLNEDCRSRLVACIDNGAIFELPESGAGLQQGQVHKFHLKAQPQLLSDTEAVFPPFVCIYSVGANANQQWRAEDINDQESAYVGKKMPLRLGLTTSDLTDARPLCTVELGLCMVPYSVTKLRSETVYAPEADPSDDQLERYRALVDPAVISNIKLEEQEGSAMMILAGVRAPAVQVQLPQESNKSSLQYTLPSPEPSSLSLEWSFEGERCLLQYHPAVYDARTDLYTFSPVIEERKEGEQLPLIAHGEGVAPVGQFGKLDKAGKWSYCVTYTEQRPAIADVLTDRVKTQTVVEDILPSIPHSLRVQRSEESSVTMPIVSNSSSGNRIIARNIRLFIVDQYGSAVHLPLMSIALRRALLFIKVIVEPIEAGSLPAAAQRRSPPQLRVEQPAVNNELHCLELSSVTVVDPLEGSDADSGQYAAIFSLPEPFSAQFHCSLRFFFSNERQLLEERRLEEQRRSERRQQLAQLFTQAQAAVTTASGELGRTGQSIDSLRRWRQNLVVEEDSALTTLHPLIQQASGQQIFNIDLNALSARLAEWRIRESASLYSNTPHPFVDLDRPLLVAVNTLAGRLIRLPAVLWRDRTAQHDPLTIKEDGTPLDREHDGYYGMLASFCTVEDPRVCQVISYHFGPRFSNYLVLDWNCSARTKIDQKATSLRMRNVTAQYVEGQTGYQLPDTMPHSRLPAAAQQTITGRPRYVFHLFSFPEQDVQLRQLHQRTIQRVVRNTMVMSSMHDIRVYRNLLTHYGVAAPTILALREQKPWYADNTERLGLDSAAPPLQEMVPRIGVQTVSIDRLIEALQPVREKVESVIRETAKIRQQWAANRWTEKEAQQRQSLAAAERKKAQLEAELNALAEQVGPAAAIAPAVNGLLNRSVGSNDHRRRQAR